MNKTSIQTYIGLAGIDSSEKYWKQQLGFGFTWLSLIIAFWLPIEWYFERHQLIPFVAVVTLDWCIWAFFAVQLLIFAIILEHRSYYFLTNWMIVIIAIYLFPLFWLNAPEYGAIRAWRLLMALLLSIPWAFEVGFQLLKKNQIWATMTVFITLVFLSGLFITTFDSGIRDPFEGAWWSFETLSTVGYGDIVPTTWGGKIFAGFVMVSGIFISSLLTAHITSYFLGKNTGENREKLEKNHELLLKTLEQSNQNFQMLSQRLVSLQEKFDQYTEQYSEPPKE